MIEWWWSLIELLAVTKFFFHSNLSFTSNAFLTMSFGLTSQCCYDKTNNRTKKYGNEEKQQKTTATVFCVFAHNSANTKIPSNNN